MLVGVSGNTGHSTLEPAKSVGGSRIAAYVMAADPTWIEESVRSYYDIVDRIVVSYDKTSTSWTGTPIRVDEALERLRAMDVASKMILSPGSFFRQGEHALANDTYQRQTALTEASEGADWVVQLDTDEVFADPAEFLRCLRAADNLGYSGLEYPARVMYQHMRGNLYLEQCRRFWTVAAGYPGPVAVRANSTLTLCRQGEVKLYRVDFRSKNTDPSHPADAPVHHVIRPDQAIVHYSWVRSDEHMLAKSRSSGHANDFDWEPVIARWRARRRHPFRTVVTAPIRRGADRRFLRITRIRNAPDPASRRRNGLRT